MTEPTPAQLKTEPTPAPVKTETPQTSEAVGPKQRPAARRGATPPRGIAVPALALAAFLGSFSVMSLRMGAGEDPALGAGTKAATPAPQARRVLVRRIVKKTVILPPREPAVASASAGGAGGGGASAGAAPVGLAQGSGGAPAPSTGGGGASAPAPSAPTRPSAPTAPAPAPAAPAPAPTTRAS
jgi:uncharacterized membrane protein YgcG